MKVSLYFYIGFFAMCFIQSSHVFAQNECVKEGDSVGIYPNAPPCCEGLDLKPPAQGVYGSAGKCVKTQKKEKCVKEGDNVGIYPNAPSCCEDLKHEPSPPGVYGSAGKCVKKEAPSPEAINDSEIEHKGAGASTILKKEVSSNTAIQD